MQKGTSMFRTRLPRAPVGEPTSVEHSSLIGAPTAAAAAPPGVRAPRAKPVSGAVAPTPGLNRAIEIDPSPGAALASKRKVSIVPQRRAFALGSCAKVWAGVK